MDWPRWLTTLACDRLFLRYPLSKCLFDHTEQLTSQAINSLPFRLEELELVTGDLQQIIYRVLTSQTIVTASATANSSRRSTTTYESSTLEGALLEHAFLREHFLPQIITLTRHLPEIDFALLSRVAENEKLYYQAPSSRILLLEQQLYFTSVAKRANYTADNIVDFFISATLADRLCLVLSELFYTLYRQQNSLEPSVNSVLFLSDSLCMHIGDILCVLIDAGSVTIQDATAALLSLPHGLWHICRLTVNFPLLFEPAVIQIIRVLEALGAKKSNANVNNNPPLWSLVVFKLLKLRPNYLGHVLEVCLRKRTSLRDVFLLAEARCCDMITTVHPPILGTCDSVGNFVLSILKMLLVGVAQDGQQLTAGTSDRGLNSLQLLSRGGIPHQQTQQNISKWAHTQWREHYRQFESSFQQLRSVLMCYMTACVHRLESRSVGSNIDAVLLISPDIMTIYAACGCLYSVKWTDDETRMLLRLITYRAADETKCSAAVQKHMTFGLAIVLLGASERGFNEEDGMHTLKSWLHWLLKLCETFTGENHHQEDHINAYSNFADILLLFGTNFYSGAMESLNDLVQKILGFRLPTQVIVTSAHAQRMARTFAEEIFTDQVLALHSSRVPPTKQLSTLLCGVNGIVPAHCILQLIQAGVFSRANSMQSSSSSSFSVRKWILHQIQQCTAPVHGIIVELIESFNQQCVFPLSPNANNRHQQYKQLAQNGKNLQFSKFNESEVCNIFTGKNVMMEDSDAEIGTDDASYAALMLLQSSNTTNNNNNNFSEFDAENDATVVPRLLMLYAILNFNDRTTQWLWSTIKAGGKLPPPPSSASTTLLLTSRSGNSLAPYSMLLLQNLPVKVLLRRMEAHRDDYYGCIYAKLMRCMLQQLPHLCQVEDFLDEQQYLQRIQQPLKNSINVSTQLDKLVKTITFNAENVGSELIPLDYAEILNCLQRLSCMQPQALVCMQNNFLQVLSFLSSNIDAGESHATRTFTTNDVDCVEEFVRVIIVKLNLIAPARLWCDLVSLYVGSYPALWRIRRSIDFEKLCDEPLVIFQAFLSNNNMLNNNTTNHTYQFAVAGSVTSILVEFFLRIFKCCLSVQTVQWQARLLQICYDRFHYAQEQQQQQRIMRGGNNNNNADINKLAPLSAQNSDSNFNGWPPSTGAHMLELTQKYTTKKLDSYLKLQSSASIQCLLEFCQEIVLKTKTASQTNSSFFPIADRILSIICNHLHQEFIHDAYVGKLVAFQGFALELLPLLVARVPSFHICIDFVAELLGQWQLNKKIFAYHLLANLACKYRVQNALNVSHMAVDVANTLLAVCDNREREMVFASIAPCLVVLARLFEPLRASTSELLQQLAYMEQSVLAKREAMSVANSVFILDGRKQFTSSKKRKVVGGALLQDFNNSANLLAQAASNSKSLLLPAELIVKLIEENAYTIA